MSLLGIPEEPNIWRSWVLCSWWEYAEHHSCCLQDYNGASTFQESSNHLHEKSLPWSCPSFSSTCLQVPNPSRTARELMCIVISRSWHLCKSPLARQLLLRPLGCQCRAMDGHLTGMWMHSNCPSKWRTEYLPASSVLQWPVLMNRLSTNHFQSLAAGLSGVQEWTHMPTNLVTL